MNKLFALILTLCIETFFTNCAANEPVKKEERIIYYASFTGYSIPIKPQQEISEKDAKSMLSYCIGYYDGSGKLYRFEKYYKGQLFFRHDYLYHENGNIRENKIIDPNGTKKITFFDEKGKPLEK